MLSQEKLNPKDPVEWPNPVCTACHERITQREKAWSLYSGIESTKRPLTATMAFTGMVWHDRCLDLSKLPGMAGRDVEEDGRGRPHVQLPLAEVA